MSSRSYKSKTSDCELSMGFGTTRRHGWQRPLHPLQIVGMSVFSFFVVAFYTFLGLFLGNRIAEITVTSIFSCSAVAVMFLFTRCTAIDPSDRTSCKKKKSKGVLKLNYGYIMGQIVVRYLKRLERRILKTFIRRNYLDHWKTSVHMEPLLPFSLVSMEDAVAADLKDLDISFCPLCDLQVKKHSKHCRTCNRCVEGFDHHCRWLNNCIGKRNYSTFIFLMVFLMLMFIAEGGTALAIFVRCFADKKGIEQELEKKLYMKFPSGVLAAISALLILMTAYSSAALGQLFFFHLVLIRKGMKTYDYILAMREENRFSEMDPFDDSDSSSDESADFVTPEKVTCLSRFSGRQDKINQSPKRLSIRIDKTFEPEEASKKPGLQVSINPWKLIKVNTEKALLAAEKARQRLMPPTPLTDHNSLKPLPKETISGPILKNHSKENLSKSVPEFPTTPFKAPSVSPRRRSSPRRRFSGSSTTPHGNAAPSPRQKYKSNFDLKLTEVSRELETYISKQVLCSALKKKNTCEISPR